MSNIKIYKNGKLKLDTGFSKDYEKFKQEMGTYSIIGLLLKLLEDKPDLWNKIMQQTSFVLNNDEKNIVAKKMEEYIEKDIHNFREAEDLESYTNVVYKSKIYKAPYKRNILSLEKKLLLAISLYDKFNDPDNSDIVEIRFD